MGNTNMRTREIVKHLYLELHHAHLLRDDTTFHVLEVADPEGVMVLMRWKIGRKWLGRKVWGSASDDTTAGKVAKRMVEALQTLDYRQLSETLPQKTQAAFHDGQAVDVQPWMDTPMYQAETWDGES